MSALEQRISFLEDLLTDNPLVGDSQIDEVSERISKLKGGLVMISPGGSSELEVSECRDRIEDAVCAV
jgi:chaperonin GroEL (HSP60 family)